MTRAFLACATLATGLSAALLARPAAATDLFGGVYAHDVGLLTKGIGEGGADVEIGVRLDPLFTLGLVGGPAPYLFGSKNTGHGTNFGAAGLAWKLGLGPVYLRPGVGVAVHDEKLHQYDGNRRTDLGSRVLFEPELALGWSVLPRVQAEISYVHLSHAQIFSRQNPGTDMLGLRVNLHLP